MEIINESTLRTTRVNQGPCGEGCICEWACPFCAVNIEICIVNCICGVNY